MEWNMEHRMEQAMQHGMEHAMENGMGYRMEHANGIELVFFYKSQNSSVSCSCEMEIFFVQIILPMEIWNRPNEQGTEIRYVPTDGVYNWNRSAISSKATGNHCSKYF